MRGIVATFFLLFLALRFCVALDYCVNDADIRFELDGATKETYGTFLTQLRKKLTVGSSVSNGIPVLKLSSMVKPADRFVVVTLTPYNPSITISVGIDVTNVYVVAFCRSNVSYFFGDAPTDADTNLFAHDDVRQEKLGYNGSYSALERQSGALREKVPLGFTPLENAITNLWFSDKLKYGKALLVTIQMVSEAARFQKIEIDLTKEYSAVPGPDVLSFENNWSALSKAIQSASNGAFKNPVILKDAAGNRDEINTVNEAKSKTGIALLLGGDNQL